jgi:hypothetical protein
MTQLDDLIQKWSSESVASTGPGELLLRTPGSDSVVGRAEETPDGNAELRADWTPNGSLGSDAEALEGLAQAAMMMRSGLLTCAAAHGRVEIRMPVYLEGLSRQEFLGAVAEVGRAHWLLASSAAELLAQRAIVTRLESADVAAVYEQVQKAQRELDALAATPAPAAAPAGAAWAPTHVAPEGGMPAWTTPDPSAAPAAVLASRVELQVRELRGDWANVTGSNGWSGWVDARRLVPRP